MLSHELAMFFTLYAFEGLLAIEVGKGLKALEITSKKHMICGLSQGVVVAASNLLPVSKGIHMVICFLGFGLLLRILGKSAAKGILTVLGVLLFGEIIGEGISFVIADNIGLTVEKAFSDIRYHTLMGWIMLMPMLTAVGVIAIKDKYLNFPKRRLKDKIKSATLQKLALVVFCIQVVAVIGVKIVVAAQLGNFHRLSLITFVDFIYITGAALAAWLCIRAIKAKDSENAERLKIEQELTNELRVSLQNLSQAHEELIKTEHYRVLAEMSGGMAHTFNNMLASIRGRTQLIKLKMPGNSEIRDMVDKILVNVDEAADAMKRVRELTTQDDESKKAVVDLSKIICEGIEECLNSRKTNITVHQTIQPDCYIRAVRGLIKDAVMNLITNAIDATGDNGDLWIRLSKVDGKAFVSIEDNGSGMSEDIVSKIFLPFYTTKGSGGFGLGLSMVRAVVNRHEGEIKVESWPGKGTRFDIHLPLTAPNEAPGIVDAGSAPCLKGVAITIVDDNEDIALSLEEFLKTQGCVVNPVTTGEGRRNLIALRPRTDIVITDLSMPGINGLDIAKAFKGQGIPVLLITGWEGQVDRAHLKDCGISDILVKPFDFNQITEKIHSIVNYSPLKWSASRS